MDPMKRADLVASAMLVLGIAGMFVLARSAGPLIVAPEDCVEFWNASPEPRDEVPDADLWMLAEGEQDLGYGLCSLTWISAGGECRDTGTPVWKDTVVWQHESVGRCEGVHGDPVTRLIDGRLRLGT